MSLGCSIPGSVQGYLDRAFFYHSTGFFMCVSGTVPVPIGVDRVNKYFADRLSAGAENFVFSAIDPNNSLYLVGFCSDGSAQFLINEIMAFKWNAGPLGEWSHVIDGSAYDCLFNGLSAQNATMDDLDAYGPLEDVPYSLDSAAWIGTGQELCGAFGSDHNGGWFNGAPMVATLTSTEAQLIPGQQSLARGYRPMVEGAALANITGTVYARNNLSDAPVTNSRSQDKAPRDSGIIRARIRGRYHRVQLVIDDENWSDAVGIDDLEFYQTGNK